MAERKCECPPHHFIIDFENVGYCKNCSEVRDFGELLRRSGVFAAAGQRGAKARKEALGRKRGRKKKEPVATVAKISAAAEKCWQNPEYRIKQRVAHASLPGRHHKKKKEDNDN